MGVQHRENTNETQRWAPGEKPAGEQQQESIYHRSSSRGEQQQKCIMWGALAGECVGGAMAGEQEQGGRVAKTEVGVGEGSTAERSSAFFTTVMHGCSGWVC